MATRMMRAAVIRRFGGPEVLEVSEVPVPTPEGDEVLIRVETAGVGVWDAKARSGAWGGKFPLVLGAEGYGIVEAVGPEATFPVGERVWAYNYGGKKGGFYADYCAVPSRGVAHAPPRLSDEELGGTPVAAVTAWTGIHDVLEVEQSDVVVVHGATGSVGVCALQFADWTHARVFATASHDGDLLRKLGAADVFDVRTEAGRAALRAAFDEVTKVLLTAPWPDELDELLHELIIAHPNGVPVPSGVTATAFDGAPRRELWDVMNPQIESHHFQLPIEATFPLAEVRQAHEALARRGRTGTIVLRLR